MPQSMPFVDLLLCVAFLVLTGFLVRLDIKDIHEMHSQQRKAATLFDRPVALRFLDGFDTHGQRISMLPLGYKWLVIFVVHGNRLQADLDLWNEAVERNRTADLGFVGICDDSTCIRTMSDEPRKARFSTILFGDYYAMRTLLKADARRQVLIVNRESGRIQNAAYPNTKAALPVLNAALMEMLQ